MSARTDARSVSSASRRPRTDDGRPPGDPPPPPPAPTPSAGRRPRPPQRSRRSRAAARRRASAAAASCSWARRASSASDRAALGAASAARPDSTRAAAAAAGLLHRRLGPQPRRVGSGDRLVDGLGRPCAALGDPLGQAGGSARRGSRARARLGGGAGGGGELADGGVGLLLVAAGRRELRLERDVPLVGEPGGVAQLVVTHRELVQPAHRAHTRIAACPASSACRPAASAWRCSGRRLRRSSRTTSTSRSTWASVCASLRRARSLRRRCLPIPAASSMNARRSSGRALSTASSCPWPTIVWFSRPSPVSDSSSCTSISRQAVPLIA